MTDQKTIEMIKRWLGSGSIDIFGLPFAGKDDQAQRLIDVLGGTKLSSGEIFRNSQISAELQATINAGILAPSDTFVRTVLPYLSRPELQGQNLILSSVGRWEGEEVGVMQTLNEANHPLKAVIFLDISRDDALTRLHKSKELSDRGDRDDDDENALITRFKEFETKTLPVINHYRELGLLMEIDATQSREVVHAHILSALAERAKS